MSYSPSFDIDIMAVGTELTMYRARNMMGGAGRGAGRGAGQ